MLVNSKTKSKKLVISKLSVRNYCLRDLHFVYFWVTLAVFTAIQPLGAVFSPYFKGVLFIKHAFCAHISSELVALLCFSDIVHNAKWQILKDTAGKTEKKKKNLKIL